MLERLKTPPPALVLANDQLLTPPPTGGLRKRVRFTDDTEKTTSKRLAKSQKLDESAFAAYAEVQGYSDDSQDFSISDVSSEESSDFSMPTTPGNSLSISPLEKKDSFIGLALAIDAPTTAEPFRFMKLPLSVRNRVYGFLLVVPALVCVRQNHTTYHNERYSYLYSEHRELLPGISHALAQVTVDGCKFRFARFRLTNAGILQASKKVHTEAKEVMYGANDFEVSCPSQEFSPPPDFKIRLFPPGYQRLICKLKIRIRALYPLKWLINGGYAKLKDAYRGLETLTLIFELETAKKGFGKRAVKQEGEKWIPYVKRLHDLLATELYGHIGAGKRMPIWINFRVLFDGDRYDEVADLDHVSAMSGPGTGAITTGTERAEEDALRGSLKRGLAEAFELFKQ